MKTFIEFFLKRSLLVNVLTVLIFVSGTITLIGLQKEIFPKIEFDVVVISTIYPGSSPEDVEKLVTIPIERSIKGVSGIKTLNSLSSEGRSIIYIEVDPDYELDEVFDDVKNGVSVVNDLPGDVEVPVVSKPNSKLRGVIKVALTSKDIRYDELKKVAKSLRDEMERINNIGLITLDGYLEDEIRIEINLDKLNKYELTTSEVAMAIQGRNLNLSAGKIDTKESEIFVRTLAEFTNAKDIENIVIRSNSTGMNIKISDLANVYQTHVQAKVLERSQGEPAIFLSISIKETADIVTTTKAIKKRTEAFLKKYLEMGVIEGRVNHRYVDDLSFFVVRRLNVLKENGTWGMLFVFFTLFMFLNFRTSVITSLGAPLAFMVSFLFMDMMGITINLISMFGLILVLGMLVDDSIIVAEQFYQKLENGMKPFDAARDAALETIRPVIATVITTIIAFGSLFFMGGIMGKFLWPVPVVVIIALVASLFECFVILPSHLADFVHIKKSKGAEKTRWYQPLIRSYSFTLKIVLKNPIIVFIVFWVVFVASIFLAKQMRFELFPGDDVRTALIQIKGPVGVTLYQTDEAIKKMEQVALNNLKSDEYKDIRSMVGKLMGDQGEKVGSQYGAIIIYLTSPTDRERTTDEILNDLTKKIKPLISDYTVVIKKLQGGPPKGKAFDLELIGDNLEEVIALSKRVKRDLDAIDGVTSSEIDYEEGKKQIIVDVNDAEAMRLGLTTKQIAMELRKLLSRDALTEIRGSDEDTDVIITLSDEEKSKVETLSKIYVLNNQGRRISISRVAKFIENSGAFVIRRLDRKRVISVAGSLDKKKLTPIELVKKMKGNLTEYNKSYPNVIVNFGGENKDTQDSMLRLAKSGFIALGAIFFVLVVMFGSLAQPLVIMLAIPFGVTGVILTFFLFNKSLGFMAAMGVVALIGVVVNDSIVLVNFINKRRETIDNVIQAVYEAGVSRFRPVILTTFTTVAGLLPIAHAPGGDPFLKPMALSFAYGLLFSTAVTLVFIPIAYVVYVKLYNLFRKKDMKFDLGNKFLDSGVGESLE